MDKTDRLPVKWQKQLNDIIPSSRGPSDLPEFRALSRATSIQIAQIRLQALKGELTMGEVDRLAKISLTTQDQFRRWADDLLAEDGRSAEAQEDLEDSVEKVLRELDFQLQLLREAVLRGIGRTVIEQPELPLPSEPSFPLPVSRRALVIGGSVVGLYLITRLIGRSGGPDPQTFPSTNPGAFVFPTNGQTLSVDHDYTFQVKPVPGSSGEFLWGFFQQNRLVFENVRDEHHLSPNTYSVSAGSPFYRYLQPGLVGIWVRPLFRYTYGEASVITVTLST